MMVDKGAPSSIGYRKFDIDVHVPNGWCCVALVVSDDNDMEGIRQHNQMSDQAVDRWLVVMNYSNAM